MMPHRLLPVILLATLPFATPLHAAAPATRASAASPASQPATTRTAAIGLKDLVSAQVASILDDLESNGNFAPAASRADTLFDQVAAVGSDKTPDAFRDAAYARRLVHQLAGAPADKRLDLLKYLRAHDALGRTMAFMVVPTPAAASSEEGSAKPPRSGQAAPYGVLLQLRDKFGDQIDKYANLTTAICVVHDRPFERRINENLTTSPSPTDLFEYYTSNEKAMLFGIKNVPPELLIYVVDTTASIDEMTWAMRKYAGDAAIGKHFFDVAYDYEHFFTGKPKKVTQMGFTLPNILKYGGVCADQAYFAMELGKSIGVPTAYTTGKSAEAGHAWVGFVQAGSDRVLWNFDMGRYPEYRGVKGDVLDPQMRVRIPDAFVSLLAELLGTTQKPVKVADRQASIALTDAAVRVGELDGIAFKPAAIETKIADARPAPRASGVEPALELLKMAVLQNKGYPRPWFAVRKMTLDGKLSMAQKKEWRDAVLNVCGEKYPDFALALLEPIIMTVEDPIQQNQWWDTAFNMFQKRWDLAASIRMHQAKLWEDQKQPAKAGVCYEDVINRYTNAGPFVLGALAGAEKLLEGKPDKVLKLYEQTFAKATKPEQSAFIDQSNWYNIGQEYVAKLREAGLNAKADQVLGQLKSAAP